MLMGLLMALKSGLSAVISMDDKTVNKSTAFTNNCYATIQLNTDGRIYENNVGTGKTPNSDIGAWLDAGTASQVWVEYTITGGSPGTLNEDDPGAGRLRLDTSRQWSVLEITSGESHSVVMTFDFYDAATGGALLKSETGVSLTATKNLP